MKTIELLKNTIPVMYNNGMTELADFLKVMESMKVQGEELEEAMKIFMACAADQISSNDEEEEEERMTVDEKTELCKELTQIFIDKEIGLGDAIEVSAATLSNALLQLSCDDDKEVKKLIEQTTDEAVRLMTTYLAASIHGNFPGLTALRLIALRFLHLTSRGELMKPILKNALEEGLGDTALDALVKILGIDEEEDCDNDCESCDHCCHPSENTTEIEIEADIKVRSTQSPDETIKDMLSGNVNGAVLAVNGDHLSKEERQVLEKLTTKGPQALTKKEEDLVKKIIIKAISSN